jgi:hypothetical protein
VTYQEICDRMLLEAQRGGEALELANLNSQSIIEAMMPSVLQDVALACWANPDKRSLLRRTTTVAIAAGVGTVDATVLTECWSGAMILEPDDAGILPEDISYVPEYVDYVAAKGYEPRLGYFCVKGDDQLFYVSPTDDDYASFTGNIELTAASVPAIPGDPDDPTGWPAEIESDVIDRGAEMLRGMKIAV